MSLSDKTLRYIKGHCDVDLKGGIVVVTGANSGIGFKTAETLVYKGASVIMACRNPQKGEEARQKLLKDYPDADLTVMALDLASLESIDSFVETLPPVDCFVNNAGVLHHPGEKTRDGFQLVMGTNYLGVWYLCEKLLPKLAASGREVKCINTISIIHKVAKVDYNHFYDEKGSYARSKLCLARYTNGLVDRFRGTNVHVCMNHPGMAVTAIATHVVGPLYRMARFVPINSAEKSSLSVLWLLSHKVPDGTIVGPNKGFGGWGYPEINHPVARASQGIEELMAFTKSEMARKNNVL